MTEEKELVWGIKNGDIDQVKDIIETQVSLYHAAKICTYLPTY